MKKIINGKVYDTETATKVCSESIGIGNDLKFYLRIIYKTKKGQYFLYETGGALSKMAKTQGSTTFGTSDITLLSPEEAKRICGEISPEKAEKEFEYDEG